MTREEVLDMPAGKAMDRLVGALVHELKLCSWHVGPCWVRDDREPHCGKDAPDFSCDMTLAWPVLESMPRLPADDPTLPRGVCAFLTVAATDQPAGRRYTAGWLYYNADCRWYGRWAGVGDSPALAICRARLLAGDGGAG